MEYIAKTLRVLTVGNRQAYCGDFPTVCKQEKKATLGVAFDARIRYSIAVQILFGQRLGVPQICHPPIRLRAPP